MSISTTIPNLRLEVSSTKKDLNLIVHHVELELVKVPAFSVIHRIVVEVIMCAVQLEEE
jgi:hypothetical protein